MTFVHRASVSGFQVRNARRWVDFYNTKVV